MHLHQYQPVRGRHSDKWDAKYKVNSFSEHTICAKKKNKYKNLIKIFLQLIRISFNITKLKNYHLKIERN